MARRKYTPEEKQRLLGVLAASAETCGGDPDYRRISQAEAIPYTTLQSWWRRSDPELLRQAASVASRVRQEQWKDGGQVWMSRMQTRLREQVEAIAELDWTDDGAKDAARTAETMARVLRDHRVSMGLAEQAEAVETLAEEQMRERMKRAGMLEEG